MRRTVSAATAHDVSFGWAEVRMGLGVEVKRHGRMYAQVGWTPGDLSNGRRVTCRKDAGCPVDENERRPAYMLRVSTRLDHPSGSLTVPSAMGSLAVGFATER